MANLINNEILSWANGIRVEEKDDAGIDEAPDEDRASCSMDRLERRLLGKRESALIRSKEEKAKQEDTALAK